MKSIAYEDRANPGTLKVPQSFSLTQADRSTRERTILNDLRSLGNCRIYRVVIKDTKRGRIVTKQTLITTRGLG